MKRFVSAAVILLTAAAPLHAADVLKKVKDMPVVKNLFGDQAQLVEARDLGSIYEIVASAPGREKQVFYVTKDGSYVLAGNLINRDKKNLTKERLDEVNKVDMARVPLADAIVITRGNGGKKLIMFTDVDCPYCRKAYEWLKTQNDFTLYVFLSPLPMHPQAGEKSVRVFCDKDPEAALALAHADKGMTGEACEAGQKTLEQHKALANELGISGTPLFLTDSGIRISGFDQAAIQRYLKN